MSKYYKRAIYCPEYEERIKNLKEELAASREAATHIYNSGYHAGHHDTVEGRYVDIVPTDMDTYHAEEVAELLAERSGRGDERT
jgi:hypothetical protein